MKQQDDCAPASTEFDANIFIPPFDVLHPPITPQDARLGILAGTPHGIAVIDVDVFVIDDEKLVRLTSDPVDGGWASSTIADLGPARGLSTDGRSLFWTRVVLEAGAAAIMRLQVRPQFGVPEMVAPSTLPIIEGIAASDAGVRWLEHTSGLREADGDGGARLLFPAPIPVSSASPMLAGAHFSTGDSIVSIEDGGPSVIALDGWGVAVAADTSRVFVAREIDGGIAIGPLADGGALQKLGSLRALALELRPLRHRPRGVSTPEDPAHGLAVGPSIDGDSAERSRARRDARLLHDLTTGFLSRRGPPHHAVVTRRRTPPRKRRGRSSSSWPRGPRRTRS